LREEEVMMKSVRSLLAVLGLGIVVVLSVGCNKQKTETPGSPSRPAASTHNNSGSSEQPAAGGVNLPSTVKLPDGAPAADAVNPRKKRMDDYYRAHPEKAPKDWKPDPQ